MIENFEDMKNIPVTNMTIGDILKYFEVIAERKHGGDEDVKRSVSEVTNRFMVEAMYKYYNCNEFQSETSNETARSVWKLESGKESNQCSHLPTQFKSGYCQRVNKQIQRGFASRENYIFRRE